ncbi:hypothetical protein D3C84_751320 [compost metagenome]
MADHPGAAAHAAFGHRSATGIGQRGMDVFGSDMLAPDVIEHAVVGFQYRGHAPVGALLAQFTLGRHQCITDHADTVGVGVGDRGGQQTGLANPLKAAGIAVAVEHMHAGEARLQVRRLWSRLDDGDTGVHRLRTAFIMKGVMAHTHARHIGDGVVDARFAHANTNAQVTNTHCFTAPSGRFEGRSLRCLPRDHGGHDKRGGQPQYCVPVCRV